MQKSCVWLLLISFNPLMFAFVIPNPYFIGERVTGRSSFKGATFSSLAPEGPVPLVAIVVATTGDLAVVSVVASCCCSLA